MITKEHGFDLIVIGIAAVLLYIVMQQKSVVPAGAAINYSFPGQAPERAQTVPAGMAPDVYGEDFGFNLTMGNNPGWVPNGDGNTGQNAPQPDFLASPQYLTKSLSPVMGSYLENLSRYMH